MKNAHERIAVPFAACVVSSGGCRRGRPSCFHFHWYIIFTSNPNSRPNPKMFLHSRIRFTTSRLNSSLCCRLVCFSAIRFPPFTVYTMG